ncbi:MAG TPA: hypothetical protein VFG01_01035 [Acidobacteriota bacterium]|nr:hypothetical protein [Acidobacteriota bacterium]
MADKKKFKPVHIRDANDEQKKTINLVKNDWVNHPFPKNYHEKWKEEIAFLEGDQYLYYSKSTNQLEDTKPYIEREVKNVYNRILPSVRQAWSDIQYPHEYYLYPGTNEDSDLKAARIGTSLIDFTNEEGEFREKANWAKLYSIVLGACYWKEWWNEDLSGFMLKDGKAVKVKGDVDYNWVNPFNARPDPSSIKRKGWRWFMEGIEMPLSKIEDVYGLEPGTLSSSTKGEGIGSGTFYAASSESEITGKAFGVSSDSGIFRRESRSGGTEALGLAIERWQRPSSNHPNGRYVVVCGDWLLWDGDNPAPNRELPYFKLPGIVPKIGSIVSESLVRVMIPAQRQYNQYMSYIDEFVKNFRTKGMIPFGSMPKPEYEKFTRAGVDYLFFNPRLGNPYYQNPPPLPEGFIERAQTMENEIGLASSIRKPSLGQLPQYTQRPSGVFYKELVARDKAVLYPTLDEMDKSFRDAIRFRLELIKQKYSVSRLIKVGGEGKGREIFEFKGAELGDNSDVRIKAGVDIFTNKEKKEEIVMSMVQNGTIKDPKEALNLMGHKGIGEYTEEAFIDERQAERRLDKLKNKSKQIIPDPDDNHSVHFKVFNTYRKKEEFEDLDKAVQDRILKYMYSCKNYMEEAASEAAPTPGGAGEVSLEAQGKPPASQPLSPKELQAMKILEKQGG